MRFAQFLSNCKCGCYTYGHKLVANKYFCITQYSLKTISNLRRVVQWWGGTLVYGVICRSWFGGGIPKEAFLEAADVNGIVMMLKKMQSHKDFKNLFKLDQNYRRKEPPLFSRIQFQRFDSFDYDEAFWEPFQFTILVKVIWKTSQVLWQAKGHFSHTLLARSTSQ